MIVGYSLWMMEILIIQESILQKDSTILEMDADMRNGIGTDARVLVVRS